jgi:hypothetical protein
MQYTVVEGATGNGRSSPGALPGGAYFLWNRSIMVQLRAAGVWDIPMRNK